MGYFQNGSSDLDYVGPNFATGLVDTLTDQYLPNNRKRTDFLVKLASDMSNIFEDIAAADSAVQLNKALISYLGTKAAERTPEQWGVAKQLMLDKVQRLIEHYLCDEEGELDKESFAEFMHDAFWRLGLLFAEIVPEDYEDILDY